MPELALKVSAVTPEPCHPAKRIESCVCWTAFTLCPVAIYGANVDAHTVKRCKQFSLAAGDLPGDLH